MLRTSEVGKRGKGHSGGVCELRSASFFSCSNNLATLTHSDFRLCWTLSSFLVTPNLADMLHDKIGDVLSFRMSFAVDKDMF